MSNQSSEPRSRRFHAAVLATVLLAGIVLVAGQVPEDQQSPSRSDAVVQGSRTLTLTIRDATTGEPTAARFTLLVDGKPFDPGKLGPNGLRFVSVHESKGQVFVVTYTRGRGPVRIELPKDARTVEIHAAKGFEYRPATEILDVTGRSLQGELVLERWTNRLGGRR